MWLFFLRQREDSTIAQIVAQLHPGLTNAELQEVLGPIHRSHKVTQEGNLCIIFYWLDGYVTVVMDNEGEKVERVTHQPDLGPWYERLRRKWEFRLR